MPYILLQQNFTSDYKSTNANTSTNNSTSDRASSPQLRAFVTLGPDLDGWPGLCNGGVTATLLDTTMAALVEYYLRAQGISASGVTTDLAVKYLKAVKTSSVVVIYAWIEKLEGRKYHLRAEVVDGTGEVLAMAEAVEVLVRAKI